MLWHCRKCRGSSWLLSEPTRLPSTGANGEVHTRFWGERLSGISPGRLKATGLALGSWVAVALWGPSGMSASRAWVPPEATNSSEIIRTRHWVNSLSDTGP